jgi:hypothetical protein
MAACTSTSPTTTTVIIGCVAFDNMMFSRERSMLDCELSDMEEKPSDEDKGGESPPELEVVQEMDRERPTGHEKTGMKWTSKIIRSSSKKEWQKLTRT